ncbi:tRNA (adenosine(37)-N6)-dimethylallyltransferase MiaA [Granulicella arctica]|uniref:tRNA (adenosine(37)-N6)-dimethylallyltransferase MiaA n=1 Tax=Granulicella arctica TaxID=940613 RepID=UPI0021DF6C49|nr:tRNA (adenosine(37)-N6)-dimethylallyltransferase MiaA [Granulicella arctica]
MVDTPLIVLAGPTASGKTALAIHLAEEFGGEIVSCDSVAVYRGMEIGTAKPSVAERSLVPHHLIDVVWPDEACTAGDYSHLARESLIGIRERGHLPIVAGGTGLYLRALIDGLFPSPPRQDELRDRLRKRAEGKGAAYLHRILCRLDPAAAKVIHPNDVSKAIRAIEVSLAARQPLTEQWQKGRDALTGYGILRLGLNPPRERLYERINLRAAAMFERGLVEETEQLVERYGFECRPFTSLGYAEAIAVLRGECTRDDAIRRAQQGHRNYAKRQGTWFRREPEMHWLVGCGGDEEVWDQARGLVVRHLSSYPRGTS